MPGAIAKLVLMGGLLCACGTDQTELTPDAAGGEPQDAGPTQAAAVFVSEVAPGAQVFFVGEQRTSQMDGWPDAMFIPLSTFSVEVDGIPNEFPPADSMAQSLARAGVGDADVVIIGEPIPAGRAWAAFDYLGLGSRAALLDGGFAALGTAPPPQRAEAGGSALHIDVRNDMIVDAAWVHQHLQDPDVIILDARPAEEFSGQKPGAGIQRPGHIPGARNLFWQTLVQASDNPVLKDETELRRLFEQAGAATGKTVVAYCRTGGQASFLYAVARQLGYETRLYDGSFIEWSGTEYPVER